MANERLTPRFRVLLRSLVVNAALPLALVQILTHRGVDLIVALAISAAFPVGWTLVEAIRRRKIDLIAGISLFFIVAGIGASFLTHDPRLALAKESFGTGLLGLICLGSLLAPRPLMFYFGREFATGGDPARVVRWDQAWQFAFFRKVQRTLTAVWGVAWLLEASLRFSMAYHLAPPVTLVLSPILAIVTTLALVAWTIAFARWASKRGEALRTQSVTPA
jgi:hypothetical protein